MADLNANKVDDMLEALNRAIEIHTKNAVQGLPYNKSELVEIVDITERNLGKYIVWNGSARYQAFSENTTYEMGTKVYVNIPNDDFKEQKHIIGPYVSDGESAVFYKNPLTDFQPLTGNILQDSEVGKKKNNYDTTCGLVANYNKQGKTVIIDNEEVPSKEEVVEIYRAPDLNGSSYQGYKYIGISADFKTLLNTFSPIAGDYGIVVTIWHAVKYDVQEDSAIEKRDYFLSVKDMIGNVYNFNTYFKQAVLYDISAFGDIQSIIIGFYQRGNFLMSNNKEVPTHYTLNGEKHLLSDNILIRNVSVTFGDDLMEDNDRATISTRNGSTYDPAQKDVLNYKNIKLQWTHLNSTSDEFEVLDSTKASSQCGDYKIHWYEDAVHGMTDYIAEAKAADETAETQMKAYIEWDKIETNMAGEHPTYTETELQEARIKLINTFNLRKDSGYTVDENGIYHLTSFGEQTVASATSNIKSEQNERTSIAGDTLAGNGWKPLGVAGQKFEWTNFLPNYKRSYSKVMAIIEYDEGDTKHKIKSNILQFDNLRITSNSLSDDKANALRIGFSDGTGGDYPIYNGTTGELLSREDVTRIRKFQATCKSLIDNKDYLNGNETIIWQIPKIGSMIQMNQTFLNGVVLLDSTADEFTQFSGTLDYDSKYYYIKRSASNESAAVNSEQTYQIAQYYNKANTNNTIYCYIIKNNDIFKGSASLTFGQHGTSGTDYTFSLGFIQKVDTNWNVVGPGDTALTIGDEDYLEIGFELFNSKNEKIDLTSEQKNDIIKLWVDPIIKDDTNIDGYYSGLILTNNNTTIGNAKNLDFITTKNGNDYDRVAVRVNTDKTTDINDLLYIVLQAAVTGKKVQNNNSILETVKFIQLLPIHIRVAETDWILRGSDYITYDDKGANPSCYNDYYELIGTRGIINTAFYIKTSDDNIERSYLPSLISLNNGINYKLQPTPLYISNLTREIAITCGEGEAAIYTCPLVILQNKYQIPAINNWNGELTVDQEGNKILAAMVGAGHKNDNNTFTGVLMGDVVHDDEELTGLFGYDAGARVFELNTNGKAFIGKSGNGRIYVDGNTGRIISAEREAYENTVNDNDPRGTEINLKDNFIDIQGIGNQSRVHIETPSIDQLDKPYFYIDSANGSKLISIGGKDNENKDIYYLQTDNYSDINKSGLKLDLLNGVLNSYNKITIKGAKDSSIYFGDENNYVTLGDDNGSAYLEMERKKTSKEDITKQLNNIKAIVIDSSKFNANPSDYSINNQFNDNDPPGSFKYYSLVIRKYTRPGDPPRREDDILITLEQNMYADNTDPISPTMNIAKEVMQISDAAGIEYSVTNNNVINTYISNIKGIAENAKQALEKLKESINDKFINLNNAQEDTNYISILQQYNRLHAEYEEALSIYNELNNISEDDINRKIDLLTKIIDYEEGTSTVDLTQNEKNQLENYPSFYYPTDENKKLYDDYQLLIEKKTEYSTASQTLAKMLIDITYIEDYNEGLGILGEWTNALTSIQNQLASEIDAATRETLERQLEDVQEIIATYKINLYGNVTEPGPEPGHYTDASLYALYKAVYDEYGEKEITQDDISAQETAINTAFNNWQNKINDFKEERERTQTNLSNSSIQLDSAKAILSREDIISILEPGVERYYDKINTNLVLKIADNTDLYSQKQAKEKIISDLQDDYDEMNRNYNWVEPYLLDEINYFSELGAQLSNYKTTYDEQKALYDQYMNSSSNLNYGYIKITNTGSDRIKVGDKFKVKENGDIEAAGGVIGNWIIGDKYLKGRNTKNQDEIFLLSQNQTVWRQVVNGGIHRNWRILAGYNGERNVDSTKYNANGKADEYKFAVDDSGNMYASAGTIGGWEIYNGYLTSGTGENQDVIGLSTKQGGGSKNYAFIAGGDSRDNWSKAKFRVKHDGTLYASNAHISGEITGSTIYGGEIKTENLKINEKLVDFYNVNIVTSLSISCTTATTGIVSNATYNGNGSWTFDRKNLTFPTKISIVGSRKNITFLGISASQQSSTGSSATGGSVTSSSVTGGGCFVKGTKILMSDFSLKNIETISVGDYVLSYNEKLKKYEPDKVLHFIKHEKTHRVVDLYLDDGSTVVGITSSHPILTTNGWKSLDKWLSKYEHWVETTDYEIGDIVLCANFEKKKIEKIVWREELPNLMTYTFHTEKNHTFIANGIIAHNAGPAVSIK